MLDEYCKLLDVSRNTYYVHKRENRPIVDLLEKYFTKEELQEFLETKKINRLETSSEANKENEEFAFRTAIYKLKNNKSWAVKLFYRVLSESNASNKLEYLIALDSTETKLLKLEHSNWKNIIREFVEDDLSNLEIKMLIKNKAQIKQIISEKSKEED